MSRYYPNKKREADHLHKIDITWLKKHNYLHSWSYGTLTWDRVEGEKDWIQIQVSPKGTDKYIHLRYRIGRTGDQKTLFEYRHALTTTPCNYGGVRYWFVCAFCGKRVGTLYLGNPLFCCRHCLNLSYSSKNENRRNEFYPFTLDRSFNEKKDKIRVKHYKGSPTKRYQRLLNKGGYLTNAAMHKMLYRIRSKSRILSWSG